MTKPAMSMCIQLRGMHCDVITFYTLLKSRATIFYQNDITENIITVRQKNRSETVFDQ